MPHTDLKTHWNEAYQKKAVEQLGWYEAAPSPSLELIEKTGLPTDAAILHVGAGATTLVDELLRRGYSNLIVNDLSEVALERLRQRLGKAADDLTWVVDDLTRPERLPKLPPVDLWHDRAVLHFFTEEKDQNTYFDLLRRLVRPGGYAIIATFNLQGATKCSGLPVFRYDEKMLDEKTGPDFRLVESFNYTYVQPSGNTREYVYTLFKKK
ncbi:MAG: class I SAM-dependent methyltransferase [Bacteroidetes bacterium]|nr:MAG: class I SAM-dependent methyltransferase [Bacteroidota bacterium]